MTVRAWRSSPHRLERPTADALAPRHVVGGGEVLGEGLGAAVAAVPLALDGPELGEALALEEGVLATLAVGLDPDEARALGDAEGVGEDRRLDRRVAAGSVGDPRGDGADPAVGL